MKDYASVDDYLRDAKTWRAEIEALRAILLDCGLSEAVKWGKPCYMHEDDNVAIIQPFKDFCALMFFKGSLLEDPAGILERPGPNSRVARRIHFDSVPDVAEKESTLRTYVDAAVAVEDAGLEVELDPPELEYPEELIDKFDEDGDFREAFEGLTPGRQRGYLLHFSSAKQSKTRRSRIEKAMPRIFAGKGINDR